MQNELLDLIGDLHGEAEALHALLRQMGYRRVRGCYRHPRRRALFLGDYLDRGPAIRETLVTVRAMVEAGSAIALCGNHELSQIQYHTPDGRGGWLRAHTARNIASTAKTRAQCADGRADWPAWLRWLQSLPLHFECEGLRAAHACWDRRALAVLGKRNNLSDGLLHACSREGTLEYQAVATLLKGPEVPLPTPWETTPEGRVIDNLRLKWWQTPAAGTYRELCLDPHVTGPAVPIPPEALADWRRLREPDRRLNFFGHYWLSAARPARLDPLTACLDYSVCRDGLLVAYRWSGETEIDKTHFACVRPRRERR